MPTLASGSGTRAPAVRTDTEAGAAEARSGHRHDEHQVSGAESLCLLPAHGDGAAGGAGHAGYIWRAGGSGRGSGLLG